MQTPNATIAVSSKSLNIDKLLGVVAGLPKTQGDKPQKTRPAKSKSGDVIADSLPPGLVAQGSVKVDKAIYRVKGYSQSKNFLPIAMAAKLRPI
jgi:hypothetical protein